MIPYNWRLYSFAFEIGLSSIAKGHLSSGAKQLLAPILYWRFPEFSFCLDAIDSVGSDSLRILDIGSPKLLSLFLALERNHSVYATDLQDEEIFKRYRQHYVDRAGKRKDEKSYIVQYQDARALDYPSDSFDVVYSLEVLGHIPDEGDTEAIREIHRVLKKDGLAIIAVPYAREAREVHLTRNIYDRHYQGEPVFYLRSYDENTLSSRLLGPSDMSIVEKAVLGEKVPFESLWERLPLLLKIPFVWSEPLISCLNLRCMEGDVAASAGSGGQKRAMNVTVVLKKQ